MKSISEINIEYKNLKEEEYESFVNEYKDDERNGVIKLVKSVNNKIDALNKEKERMKSMFSFEREYSDYEYICGVDEEGFRSKSESSGDRRGNKR